MAIQFHPDQGTILICDFTGFKEPEMTKRRPVIVVSPRFRRRKGLCSVVPLSTTAPNPPLLYHYKLHTNPPLPAPYNANEHWVKADMVYTVSFDRLFLPFDKKNTNGKRMYDVRVIDKLDLIKIQECIIHGLGLGELT